MSENTQTFTFDFVAFLVSLSTRFVQNVCALPSKLSFLLSDCHEIQLMSVSLSLLAYSIRLNNIEKVTK